MQKKAMVIFAVPIILIAILAIFFLAVPEGVNKTGSNYSTEILAENLEVPWALAFLPDDRLIFTERGGNVSILEDQNVKTVGTINVTQNSESGLLGIAVDPNFTQNNYIYLYYTFGDYNLISRFKLERDQLSNETILVDNIPAAQIHDAGRLKFGPDGKLYATTGDSGDSALAQNLSSLAGKILRLNSDGTVPDDNPYGTYVYSYGHRDPQGITWDEQGIMYASEHGQTRNDEINIITKGGNYGWPLYEGNDTAPGFIKPLRAYTEFTLAPSGIAYYENALYVAGLRGSQLRKLNLSADGKTILGEEALLTDLGRIRDVVEHEGYLYISTCNRDGRGTPQSGDDKIIRIKLD